MGAKKVLEDRTSSAYARIKWLQKMPGKRVPKTCSMASRLIVRADVCCCCCVNSVHTCAKTSAASAAFFASSADSNLKNTASPPPGDSTMAPDLILSCSEFFSTAICRQSAEKISAKGFASGHWQQ